MFVHVETRFPMCSIDYAANSNRKLLRYNISLIILYVEILYRTFFYIKSKDIANELFSEIPCEWYNSNSGQVK